MASIIFNNITYITRFVDLSAGVNGDGLTINTPTNIFPSLPSISSNTALIVRRSGNSVTLTAASQITGNYVIFAGSPKKQDPLYYIIPNASVWESDPYPTFTVNITGSSTASGLTFSGSGSYIENVAFVQTVSGGTGNHGLGTSAIIQITQPAGVVRSCTISGKGVSYNDTSYTYSNRNGVLLFGENSIVDNCYIEVPDNCLYYLTTQQNISILNTTLKNWNTSTASNNIYSGSGSTASGKYYGNTLYCKSGTTQVWSGVGQFDILNSYFFQDNATNNSYILYATSSNFVRIIGCSFYMRPRGTSAKYFMSLPASISHNLIKFCTFQTLDDQSSSGMITIFPTGTNDIYNCTFSADAMIASLPSYITTFSNCIVVMGNPYFSIPYYTPYLLPHKYSTNTNAIGSTLNSTLYVGTLSLSGIPVGNRWINVATGGKVFIDNLDVSIGNGSSYSYLNFNSDENCAVYVKNEVNAGNWTARSLKTYMNTSNTYRTNGKNYSIKCQSFSAPSIQSRPPYLWIAPLPFAGIPIVFGTTGNKKLTLYFAQKLYDPNDQINTDDIVVEADIPFNNFVNATTTVSSKTAGSISTTDTSIWNNDSGLTVSKLEMYFNLPIAGTIYCRIGFFKYQSAYPSGYVVIDPGIIGEDIA